MLKSVSKYIVNKKKEKFRNFLSQLLSPESKLVTPQRCQINKVLPVLSDDNYHTQYRVEVAQWLAWALMSRSAIYACAQVYEIHGSLVVRGSI